MTTIDKPGPVANWKCIWQLNVPPKVRHFVWRMTQHCLPTRSRLHEKGVACPLECVVCGSSNETAWHALVICPRSKRCWQRVGLWDIMENMFTDAMSLRELFFIMTSQLQQDRLIQFTMTIWSLWLGRNEKLWNSLNEACGQILKRAEITWGD